MVRNNNVIPNSHFRKDWDKRVRVYLDQASKKKKRSVARQEKAAKVFPKPVSGLLRPVVRCMSIKYNRRQRLGRGFTLEELRVSIYINICTKSRTVIMFLGKRRYLQA